MVITVNIKIPGFKVYTLDAQIDTRDMSSCCKYKAIPAYYWQPTQIQFHVVNKEIMAILHVAPDFPIMLNDVPTYVTLYSRDTGADIFLGQDFVKRHMPLIVNIDSLILTIQQNQVKLPLKSSYIMRVTPETPDILEDSLQDLTKIQKIVRHADIHGQEFLKDIIQKLRDDCTADFPDAFWTREKYCVSLPYK
jgi:hypothetical protein